MKTYEIRIEGLVQGVGFRPYIHRLAGLHNLKGTVENRNTGVLIHVNTNPEELDNLIREIKRQPPRHARIDNIYVQQTGDIHYTGFSILGSRNLSSDITEIGPDIAVCSECLIDMELQQHRTNYPLINCTNCGPRFSIIKGVPYDRILTTMADFEMCEKCSREYNDLTDRRYHAQPVACNSCGPVYSIHFNNQVNNSLSYITSIASRLIEKGSAIALKGTGGYHIICDANLEKTVLGLRMAKLRDGKPFAVMCRDIAAARKISYLTVKDKELLTSWRRPVVLLESKRHLAPSVSNQLGTVGVVLPYMPFHFILFKELKTDTVVFTSANFADEPVIISDETAIAELPKIASAVITYNRDIFNRTDDSVCRIINKKELIIRRSRGYAPSPVKLTLKTEGIFGAGAELTNCFAIGKGNQVILSQHIGDLKNAETLDFYSTSYRRFSEMFRFRPEIIAKDLHPDYLSSSFAEKLSSELNIPLENVQHHHAHIASCMADNGLNEKVIGVALDGVGLGEDGNIWGGEFMIADLINYERLFHFEYVAIAGGDKISPEPWRSGLSYLFKYTGDDINRINYLKLKEIGLEKITLYKKLLTSGINTCQYSGAGRLFDAVASITGTSLYSLYHSEAPMLLESLVIPGISRCYDFQITGNEISFSRTIAGILNDLEKGKNHSEISTVFHNTVTRSVVEAVKMINRRSGIRKIVLSGGTFQNRYLSERVITELSAEKFLVYFHNQAPANDGGLALGQVAVAAARRSVKFL